MLDAEREFFEENREELLRQFPGKFVVIKERDFSVRLRPSRRTRAGAREFGVTSFLVRRTDEVPQDVSIPA